MEKKEELARQYADNEVRRYHKHSGVIEKYGMERARMTSEHESWELEEAYEAGWDSALKHQWTIPSSRETIPNPKIVLEKGIIALLSNGRIQYQKDMRGFYWEEKDEKFVYNYSDVVAWMYAPSVDEVVGRKE